MQRLIAHIHAHSIQMARVQRLIAEKAQQVARCIATLADYSFISHCMNDQVNFVCVCVCLCVFVCVCVFVWCVCVCVCWCVCICVLVCVFVCVCEGGVGGLQVFFPSLYAVLQKLIVYRSQCFVDNPPPLLPRTVVSSHFFSSLFWSPGF